MENILQQMVTAQQQQAVAFGEALQNQSATQAATSQQLGDMVTAQQQQMAAQQQQMLHMQQQMAQLTTTISQMM